MTEQWDQNGKPEIFVEGFRSLKLQVWVWGCVLYWTAIPWLISDENYAHFFRFMYTYCINIVPNIGKYFDGSTFAIWGTGNLIGEVICHRNWYLSLFYTTAIWGQEILHLKVRKFATKLSVKFFTVCNFYTVCKAIFCVPIWLTTSGCNGRNKYQVWMWNEIFLSLSCGSKKLIGHPTMQEFILWGTF